MPTRPFNEAELLALLSFAGLGFLAWVMSRDDDDPVPEPENPPTPREKPSSDERAIRATPELLAELDAELVAAGVSAFTARDLTANRMRGKRVHFIPPEKYRANLIRVAQLGQEFVDAFGPLDVSSAYRPQDKRSSLHYRAAAIDLDLPKGTQTRARRDELYLLAARKYLATSSPSGRPGFGGMGFYKSPIGRLHIDVRKRPTFWTAALVKPYFRRARQA